MHHPTLLSSILYGTATHEQFRKRLEKPDAPPLTCREKLQMLIAKDEAIRRLNNAIRDPRQLHADEILLAILTLAFSQYDDATIQERVSSYGCPVFRCLQGTGTYCYVSLDRVSVYGHLKALLDILALRGGLGAVKMEGLAQVLSL
jgi:hypothetical protein